MLYIGNDKPLAYDPLPQAGPEICLVPTRERPAALCAKEHIGLIAECAEGKVFCSCAFNQESLPWEQQEENHSTIAAYDRLREEITAQIENGANPLVFAVWSGCEHEAPNLIWRLAPKHLRPETCLMNNGFLMPGGIPSDMMLIEIDPSVRDPQHEIRE